MGGSIGVCLVEILVYLVADKVLVQEHNTTVVDQFNFATLGNINTNFGDLSVANNHGSYSSFTKHFLCGR